MGKTLDFHKVKKEYLTTKLNDEKNTTIMIMTPTKNMLDELIDLEDRIVNNDDTTDVTNELYDMCARLMSRNKGAIKIEADHLSEIMDLEDVTIFLNSYMDFVKEVSGSKN